MRKFLYAALLLSLVFGTQSCSYRKLAYLQDMEELKTYDVTEAPDVRIRKNDKIKILVSCTNAPLAAPFNLTGGATDVNIATGSIGSAAVKEEGVEYLVDNEGCILFPVLGSLRVEGLTLKQLKEEISNLIIEKKYINDPIVTAEFTNFQITILGEVSSKGNYIVKDNRITILQAIAMAGDLTTYAQNDNIWVIRTEGGERQVYPIDLRSKSCFDSPGFWLQQDDVVYVKPRKAKLDGGSQLALTITSTVLSGLSALGSILYWTGAFGNR